MTIKQPLAAALALALAACSPSAEPVDTEAVKQQILAREEAWNQAYAKRDAEALAGMYADDAALANPRERLLRGKDAIREATAGYVTDDNLQVSFRANRVQVSQSGDLAYTRGQYLMTTTNPSTNQPESTQGYYLTVWQKQQDGSWKAVEDFITPGPPLPVAERATLL